jgi:hypothetical protein
MHGLRHVVHHVVQSSKRGKGGSQMFYTIDGKLLSWSLEPKGEEVDFLHLGKVAEVTAQANIIELKLKGNPKTAKVLALVRHTL